MSGSKTALEGVNPEAGRLEPGDGALHLLEGSNEFDLHPAEILVHVRLEDIHFEVEVPGEAPNPRLLRLFVLGG